MSGFKYVPCIVCKYRCRPIGMIAICERCAMLPVEQQSQRFVDVNGAIVDTFADPPRVVGPSRNLPTSAKQATPPATTPAGAQPRSKSVARDIREEVRSFFAELKSRADMGIRLAKIEKQIGEESNASIKAIRETFARCALDIDLTAGTLMSAFVSFAIMAGMDRAAILGAVTETLNLVAAEFHEQASKSAADRASTT